MKLRYLVLITFILITLSFNKKVIAQKTETSRIKQLYSMSIDELMNIEIITAGKKFEKIRDIPASVVIVTRNDIEMYGYKDLREIINQINGMYVSSNLGIDIYAVRGFTKGKRNNFVIMVNNIKITDEKILTFYQLPVEMIDRIEVVRGPMSVIYGNNAFFGAINIITNQIGKDEPKNLTTVSYGSLNTSKIFARLSSQSDNLKIVLNLSLFKTDGADLPLNKMITKPERMDEPLFGGEEGLGLGLPDYAKNTKNFLLNDHKYINLSASFNKFSFNLSYIEAKNGWYYYFPSLDKGSTFKNRNTTFSLSYTNDITETLKIDAKLRYSNTISDNNYNHLFEGFYGRDNTINSELEGEINLFWHLKPNLYITLGLQYENMTEFVNESNVPIAGINNDTLYYIDTGDDGITYSSFIQVDYNPFSRLKLVAGFRIEQMMGYGLKMVRNQGYLPPSNEFVSEISDIKDNGEVYIIPRLAAIFQIDEDNVFKLLYGKAIKRPGFVTIGEDLWDIFLGEKIGGYSKPEFIYTRELNFLSTVSKKIAINISFFWNTLENLIIERNEIVDDILRAWLDNSGIIETKGIEASVLIEPEKNLNIEIGGSYQKTKDKTNNVDASYSPDFTGYFKIGYKYLTKYIFSLTGNYRGSMKPFYSSNPILNQDGSLSGDVVGWTSQAVPGCFVLSTNIRIKEFLFKGVFLNINCSNLLNTDIYYPAFSINNAWADRGTLGYKRGFLITVGWKF